MSSSRIWQAFLAPQIVRSDSIVAALMAGLRMLETAAAFHSLDTYRVTINIVGDFGVLTDSSSDQHPAVVLLRHVPSILNIRYLKSVVAEAAAVAGCGHVFPYEGRITH